MCHRATVLWAPFFAFFLLCAGFASPGHAQQPSPAPVSDQEVSQIAQTAYFYAYPLASMIVTMQQATDVPDTATVPMRAPLNQFAHARAYPNAAQKDVVRFNFDTLYSFAWIDTSHQPIILTVPDTGGRYYLLEMLDMWSDVFCVVGTRTTGDKAGSFALVAPDWHGTLPPGVEKIVAPTPVFWILGRTQTNGPSDYANVHKVQDGYRLTPLNQWGKNDAPPVNQPVDASIDTKTPPLVQVNKMDGVAMLSLLANAIGKYPPHANDYPILFEMRQLGIEPGKTFDAAKLSPDETALINRAAKDGLAQMAKGMKKIGKVENGWNIATENVGTYGTSYKQRAMIALGGLGANLPEDAVYPTAFSDSEGRPLNSAHNYVVHFNKGELPPADAFWSITMYDDQGFQVPNVLNRYAIGDRDKLHFNADGSLDIYIQFASPGQAKESNWLPAPKDASFQPTMRIYSPRPSVADGSWKPPGIQRTK